MREQIDFSLTPEFQAFMSGLAFLEQKACTIVHGVFIDPHPVLKTWQAASSQTGIDFPDDFDWLIDGGGSSGGLLLSALAMNSQAPVPFRPDSIPPGWGTFCERAGKRHSPFLVKIYVAPTTRNSSAQRRVVEDYARRQPFFVTVIDAEQPSFVAKVDGSVPLTATISGTLGGFLRDGTGIWGVTCGHVGQLVNGQITLDDVNNQIINNAGIVHHSTFDPVPATCGAVCNQYVQNGLEVDTALIELSSPHTATSSVKRVGTITDIYDRTQLNSGNQLVMRGPRSGKHTYVIGGYGVTCKIAFAGLGDFCFSHLFEFSAPSHSAGAVGGRVAQAVAPRPLAGDSGSWLCFHLSGNDYAYFGNLIAVSGATGIATFADSVTGWASTLGMSLNVL